MLEAKQEGGSIILVIPHERLEYDNVNGVKNEIFDLIRQGHTRIVLEMDQVEFMDSKGLGAFLALHRAVAPDGAIALTGVTEPIRRMFALTRTDSVFAMYPTQAEALAALAARTGQAKAGH